MLFATFYNTGARVSELVGLSVGDVFLNGAVFVRFEGKGRKQRTIPLWRNTVRRLRQWLTEIDPAPTSPVFPNRSRNRLTRSGVEHRLREAVRKATPGCPSLSEKKISPHILRHTTAMHLLQAGVDLATIALWLGHENPATTHLYVEADLQMKEAALAKLQEPAGKATRYHAPDSLLAFLESV